MKALIALLFAFGGLAYAGPVRDWPTGTLTGTELTTASTAPTGADRLYFKTDHNLYRMTAAGTETIYQTIGPSGASGVTGASGSAGSAGSNGSNGAIGNTGGTGGTGSSGSAGQSGQTGQTGPTGGASGNYVSAAGATVAREEHLSFGSGTTCTWNSNFPTTGCSSSPCRICSDAEGDVSSVTTSGTGVYVINFTTAWTEIDSETFGPLNNSGAFGSQSDCYTVARTTTSVTLNCYGIGGALQNVSINVHVGGKK